MSKNEEDLYEEIPCGDGEKTEETSADVEEKDEDPFAGFETETSAPEEEAADDSDEEEAADDSDEEEAADDSDEEEADDDSDEEEAAEKPKKKKLSTEERIAEITRKRREAEREAQAQEQQRSALEEENRLLKQKLGLTEEKQDDTGEIKAPNPQDFEYGELDDKYIQARETYLEEKITAKVRAQQDEIRQTEAAERKAQELGQLRDTQIEAGVEKYEDYEKVVLEGPLNDLPPASPETGELLLKSPNGADILYHLSKNPQEAREMLGKSPIEQARYIGSLEAKFSSEEDATTKKTTKKPNNKVTKAPKPIGRARGGDGKFAVSDDTDDFAAFEQKHA